MYTIILLLGATNKCSYDGKVLISGAGYSLAGCSVEKFRQRFSDVEQGLVKTYPLNKMEKFVHIKCQVYMYQMLNTTSSTDTLHFKLSEQLWERADTAPPRGDFLTHNGPECYVRPQAKSNRKIISNAICHVCLAGEVNMSLKQRALAVSYRAKP